MTYEVIIGADELMASADALTGVHTRMTSDEIRSAQDISKDELIVRYVIGKYDSVEDSRERYVLAEHIRGAVTRSPHLQHIVSKAIPKLVIRPPKPRTGHGPNKRSEPGVK